MTDYSAKDSQMPELTTIQQQLEQVVQETKNQQSQIETLVEVTEQQSNMINKQSAMIDKMWTQVSPILQQHNRKEELKQKAMERMVTGGAYAICAGIFLLVWQGFKHYLFSE